MEGATPLDLALFVIATFGASLVAGLAGFAFGLVAAAVWLHVLTPLQTTTLIVIFGLLVQGYSVWKLRGALRIARLSPFLVGAALGVPVGVDVLRWADASDVRAWVGAVLIIYSLYSLARPRIAPFGAGGSTADSGIGFLSGILGGTTGLGGILPTVWCGLRGWPKEEQRAVFQPVAVAVFAMTALWLGGTGALSADILWLVAIGLPAMALGTWLGLRLFGRLNEAWFRRIVLGLLLVSGISLAIRW